MSNSTTLIDTITATQSNKEVVVNGNFDATSPGMIFGRRASTTANLTWGYYGGWFNGAQVSNGTVALTASATNYVVANASTGAVTASVTAPGSGSLLLYTIVTGATSVTSYTDNRQLYAGGGLGSVPDTSIAWSLPDIEDGIIDGNFDSWQTGTSFPMTAGSSYVVGYTADMWVAYVNANAAATISRVTRTPGSEPSYMTNPSPNKLRWQQTTAGGGVLATRLEGVGRFNGKSVTLSMSLQAAAAGTWVTQIIVFQNFGSGGSPSATVGTTKNVTWNVGTTESKFSARLDVPSISGKTIGTSGGDFVEVQIVLATVGTFTLDFSQAQIDAALPNFSADTTGAGGKPMPFRYLGLALERTRVSRYLLRLSLSQFGVIGSGVTQSSTSALVSFGLPTPLALPSGGALTFNNMQIIASNAGSISTYPITAASFAGITSAAVGFNCTVSGAPGGAALVLQAQTGGGYIQFDGRL